MAKATIFVGDLSRFCSDEDITSLFLPYGRVLETKIMRNPVTGISLGYGFLIMGSAESATLAMQCLHGIQLRGRPLRVKWAGRNIKNELAASYPARTARDPSVETVINSVHVRFQALHISSCLFTEESLFQFFMPFGEVIDASIKESNVDELTGLQHGYGFVHFNSSPDGSHSAFRAITELSGDGYFGLHCEGSRNFMKQFQGNPTLRHPLANPRSKNPTGGHRAAVPLYRNFNVPNFNRMKEGSISYHDYNVQSGSQLNNLSGLIHNGPEYTEYPPSTSYNGPESSLLRNQAYSYASGPSRSVSKNLAPSPSIQYPGQSTMASFPPYDAYSSYSISPPANRSLSQLYHTEGPASAVSVSDSYHRNYRNGTYPRDPGSSGPSLTK